MHTYWTSMFWPIDSCQNRVTGDLYHLTVSRAHVSTHQGKVFFEVIRWQVTSFQVIAGSGSIFLNFFLKLCLCAAQLKFWSQTDLGRVACVQTSPLPQEKSGGETSVNHRRLSCSGIHLHKLFCSFGDSWKGTCRSKNSSGVCAQASRTSSRNVPPKNPDIRSLITVKPGQACLPRSH